MMVAPLADAATLVTDENVSNEARAAVRKLGVELVTVPVSGEEAH